MPSIEINKKGRKSGFKEGTKSLLSTRGRIANADGKVLVAGDLYSCVSA